MKRLAILTLVLMGLATTAHASTQTWYPGGTDGLANSPVYAMPIPFVDGVRGCIPHGKLKRTWTHLRNSAFEQWGLPFDVLKSTCLNMTGQPTITPEDAPANTITFFVLRGGWYSGGYITAESWGYSQEHGAGYAEFQNVKRDVRVAPKGTGRIILHELGHALGFAHGGDDIMKWSYQAGAEPVVGQEEHRAIRAYYGG